jgi:hypothetical protein
MLRAARHVVCLALFVAFAPGCRTFDPKHPYTGRPRVEAEGPGYVIWFEDGRWNLRLQPGRRASRFQGSLAGVSGSVADLELSRPELKDTIAQLGNSVQFDVERASSDGSDGFSARVLGNCARFDLYLDGRRRSERVRLGPRGLHPKAVPFEHCP